MLAKCQIIGNIGRKPELKQSAQGTEFCNFSVASGRNNETSWWNVTAWGHTAKFVCTYLDKGSRVYIDGTMCVEKWTGKDGLEKQGVKVTAKDVQGLDRKAEQNTEQEAPAHSFSGQSYQTTSAPPLPGIEDVPEFLKDIPF